MHLFPIYIAHGLKRKKLEQEESHPNPAYAWNNNIHDRVLPPPSPPTSTNSSHLTEPSAATLQNHLATATHVGQPQALPAAPPVVVTESVPIFALHPKGTFYVPMSVELNLIRPLFKMPDPTTTPLLHPVTISVNFCHPLRVLGAAEITQKSQGAPLPVQQSNQVTICANFRHQTNLNLECFASVNNNRTFNNATTSWTDTSTRKATTAAVISSNCFGLLPMRPFAIYNRRTKCNGGNKSNNPRPSELRRNKLLICRIPLAGHILWQNGERLCIEITIVICLKIFLYALWYVSI